MATRILLLGAVMIKSALTGRACGTGTVEPFHSDSLVKKGGGDVGAGLDYSSDTFVADDRVVGAPG